MTPGSETIKQYDVAIVMLSDVLFYFKMNGLKKRTYFRGQALRLYPYSDSYGSLNEAREIIKLHYVKISFLTSPSRSGGGYILLKYCALLESFLFISHTHSLLYLIRIVTRTANH